MIKKAALLFLVVSPCWGSASLTMGTPIIGSDGQTVTIAISGVSGSLSPSSGITGFTVGNLSGNTLSTILSARSSGSTVTIVLAIPVQNNIAPTFSLATSGGSNLTDTGGNTPSASGNTNVSSTNNSTWYGCSAANFSSTVRYNGGPILTDVQGAGYSSPCYWASPDGGITFTSTATAIVVSALAYGSGITLFQDGTKIAAVDFGTSVIYSTWSLASGLSGFHLYDIVESSGTSNYNTVILGEIQLVGTVANGTAPTPARPILEACGDSIIGSGGAPHDNVTVDWWLNSAGTQSGGGNYGYAAQFFTASGAVVTGSGNLSTLCPTHTYPYNQAITPVAVLEGGSNDASAFIATGTVTTPNTFAGDYVTMIRGVQTNVAPPTKLLVQGILPRAGVSVSAYNVAEQNAVSYVNSTYSTNVCWYDTTGWITTSPTGCPANDTSDGIHPCGANVLAWNGVGYAKIANRKAPIFSGFVTGTSYSLSGPSSGQRGAPSSNFTVALTTSAQFTGDQIIILNDSGSGGIFTPSIGSPGVGPLTVTPAGGASSFTFTYTPSSNGGSKIITSTAVQKCWTDPAPLLYSSPGTHLVVSGSSRFSGSAVFR